MKTKPTFIGVGAMKCATTWLSECLRYHPEVFVSDIKELHFFSTNYDKGSEWYLNNFKNAKAKKAIGEFSVSYMDSPLYAERMADLLGSVKIIISVRNPFDRFISHYKHNYRVDNAAGNLNPNKIDLNSFELVSNEFPEILSKGLYSGPIKRFREIFGKENVLVIFKEDIDENPEQTVRLLYKFLEISDEFVPTIISKKVSSGIIPKYKLLENARVLIYGKVKKYFPKGIIWVRKFRIAEAYRKLNKKNTAFTIEPAVQKQLQKYYEREIVEMENLFNRDLNSWRTN